MSGKPPEATTATAFQRRCIDACRRALTHSGHSQVVFEECGERGLYFKTVVPLSNSKTLEIYVYADGVEFGINDEWTRFEKYDYKTLNDLTLDFCKKLSGRLSVLTGIRGTHD